MIEDIASYRADSLFPISFCSLSLLWGIQEIRWSSRSKSVFWYLQLPRFFWNRMSTKIQLTALVSKATVTELIFIQLSSYNSILERVISSYQNIISSHWFHCNVLRDFSRKSWKGHLRGLELSINNNFPKVA